MDVSFKVVCRELRSQGLSLGEIAERTGRPKTSVYVHIRDLPLSKDAVQRWKQKSGEHFARINAARKGVSRLDRHPVCFETWTPDRVSLVAHLIFDGQITHSSCIYTNRSLVLIDQFEEAMRDVYPYDSIRIESTPGVWRSTFSNVELSSYLKSKSNELLSFIEEAPLELKVVFLRTFFDDEGSACFLGAKRLVRGYQYDSRILELVCRLLSAVQIPSTVYAKYNELYISGKENLTRFRDVVNFSTGVCVNGQRSNSVWKQSLEKREILDRMIRSYQ